MKSSKLFLPKFIRIFGVVLSITIIGVALWIYIPETYDPQSGLSVDGLGRPLHSGMTSIFGLEKTPGLIWELIDTAIAILLFSFCSYLFYLSERLRESSTEGNN
jgi:hypothetical protein